jgi:hypothetical protein
MYEGKYSLENIYRISVDCEIMMKYLCQLMMTKKVVLNDFLKQPSEVFTVIFNESLCIYGRCTAASIFL